MTSTELLAILAALLFLVTAVAITLRDGASTPQLWLLPATLSATLLGFFDVGDALRALIDSLPDEDRKRATGEIIAPTRNVLAWMKLLDAARADHVEQPVEVVQGAGPPCGPDVERDVARPGAGARLGERVDERPGGVPEGLLEVDAQPLGQGGCPAGGRDGDAQRPGPHQRGGGEVGVVEVVEDGRQHAPFAGLGPDAVDVERLLARRDRELHRPASSLQEAGARE